MSGHRREHLESTLHRVLQVALRDLNDPRMEGLVTITGVEVSQDLKNAHVKVSVYPAKHEAKVLGALRHAHVHLRRLAGEEIRTVRIPDLVFDLDQSLKKQAGVIEALGKVAAERQAKEALALDAARLSENNPPQHDRPDGGPVPEPKG